MVIASCLTVAQERIQIYLQEGGQIHAVLLSSPSLAFCGGLPYLYSVLGCTAPLFVSLASWRLAQINLFDAVLSIKQSGMQTPYGLNHINDVFDYIHTKDINIISICPKIAGRVIGAVIWELYHSAGNHQYIYAPLFNNQREALIDPVQFSERKNVVSSQTQSIESDRPQLFITLDCNGDTETNRNDNCIQNMLWLRAETVLNNTQINNNKQKEINLELQNIEKSIILKRRKSQTLGMRKRGKEFVDFILELTLKRGSNVLIPTSPTGRLFECLYLLDRAITESDHPLLKRKITKGIINQQPPLTIAFLHPLAYYSVNLLTSLTEWMPEDLRDRSHDNSSPPIQFKNIHILHVAAQIDSLPQPVCLFVSTSSLFRGGGQAHSAFIRWCSITQNVVLFIERMGLRDCIERGERLFNGVNTNDMEVKEKELMNIHNGRYILQTSRRVLLIGDEADEWRHQQKEQQQRLENEKLIIKSEEDDNQLGSVAQTTSGVNADDEDEDDKDKGASDGEDDEDKEEAKKEEEVQIRKKMKKLYIDTYGKDISQYRIDCS
ncbi:MAG: hypothetical protein EZS28_035799, partial [Streblomastix strix]